MIRQAFGRGEGRVRVAENVCGYIRGWGWGGGAQGGKTCGRKKSRGLVPRACEGGGGGGFLRCDSLRKEVRRRPRTEREPVAPPGLPTESDHVPGDQGYRWPVAGSCQSCHDALRDTFHRPFPAIARLLDLDDARRCRGAHRVLVVLVCGVVPACQHHAGARAVSNRLSRGRRVEGGGRRGATLPKKFTAEERKLQGARARGGTRPKPGTTPPHVVVHARQRRRNQCAATLPCSRARTRPPSRQAAQRRPFRGATLGNQACSLPVPRPSASCSPCSRKTIAAQWRSVRIRRMRPIVRSACVGDGDGVGCLRRCMQVVYISNEPREVTNRIPS